MASRPNGEDIAVQLDRVTKRFGKTTALDDVSLLVRRGDQTVDQTEASCRTPNLSGPGHGPPSIETG